MLEQLSEGRGEWEEHKARRESGVYRKQRQGQGSAGRGRTRLRLAAIEPRAAAASVAEACAQGRSRLLLLLRPVHAHHHRMVALVGLKRDLVGAGGRWAVGGGRSCGGGGWAAGGSGHAGRPVRVMESGSRRAALCAAPRGGACGRRQITRWKCHHTGRGPRTLGPHVHAAPAPTTPAPTCSLGLSCCSCRFLTSRANTASGGAVESMQDACGGGNH